MVKKIILLIFCASTLFAQEHVERQFNFAEKLFEAGDYYDAVTEYKRALFFDESGKYDYVANYKIAMSFKYGARFDNAIHYFDKSIKNAENDKDRFRSITQKARCNILRKTPQKAIEILQNTSIKFGKAYRKQIDYWMGWSYIFEDNWETADSVFSNYSEFNELSKLCKKITNDKYSVSFAKVISYILPGAGQFYTGHYLSGILSLGWNALWGYYSVKAFTSERVFDGIVISNLLWFRFYRGNIQNAAKFAEIENARIYNQGLDYLQKNYRGLKP